MGIAGISTIGDAVRSSRKPDRLCTGSCCTVSVGSVGFARCTSMKGSGATMRAKRSRVATMKSLLMPTRRILHKED